VEQISHDFIFGAHIFNYEQLGSREVNDRYKDLFGDLFNSATIAFYWKTLEPEEGYIRYQGEYRDSAEFWDKVKEPKKEPHWRRPAPDPVVDFCLSKGIRLHGHTLTWGNTKWQYPDWLVRKLPERFWKNLQFPMDNGSGWELASYFENYTEDEIQQLIPDYIRLLNEKMCSRIQDIALRYKDKIHSWDICNESAADFERNNMKPASAVTKSVYGLMPGDYTYRSFKMADAFFPKSVKLNINDYHLGQPYVDQINDLQKRGCKIDIMGAQMHLFNPQTCLDIADGTSNSWVQNPKLVWETMNRLSQAELPIHLSEITIT
jgi:GH35 family endo-1,4-beta-xylanase